MRVNLFIKKRQRNDVVFVKLLVLLQSLIVKLYKELVEQQKYLKREDIRNAKKSNQLILRLVGLLEAEYNKSQEKS